MRRTAAYPPLGAIERARVRQRNPHIGSEGQSRREAVQPSLSLQQGIAPPKFLRRGRGAFPGPELPMARNPPRMREVLTTNVTIIQVQAELLRRQVRRRAGLTETDRRWLESALTTIVQAAHEVSAMLVDGGEFAPTQWPDRIPTHRLTVPSRRSHRNKGR
jgi:hypothetical protein